MFDDFFYQVLLMHLFNIFIIYMISRKIKKKVKGDKTIKRRGRSLGGGKNWVGGSWARNISQFTKTEYTPSIGHAIKAPLRALGMNLPSLGQKNRDFEEKDNARRNLEKALKDLNKAVTEGNEEVNDKFAVFDATLEEAGWAGVDEAFISLMRRQRTSAEKTEHQNELERTRNKFSAEIKLIERSAAAVTPEGNNNFQNAVEMLKMVYSKYPPPTSTITLESLYDEDAAQFLKKTLLKAQRDYHDDKNQGLSIEGYTPTEWEVLRTAILQSLTLVYKIIFKSNNTMELDGGRRQNVANKGKVRQAGTQKGSKRQKKLNTLKNQKVKNPIKKRKSRMRRSPHKSRRHRKTRR